MGKRDVALRACSNGFLMCAAVTALSVAVFLLANPASAQQMSLPGKPSVDPNGAANYSIPITVPPGTAGQEPSLSLQYNNQSGNGLLGMGWSLAGLPAVTRCPRTIAQDGAMGGVNYDANDRFCLDGQRLFAINNGAYGADGTEYRTEIESFSRVISHGTAGTGPAWFEVHTKSGQIMEFGNTADSQVLAQGKPTARSWAVNKVSDTTGNYYTVTYTVDAPNGQAYPARIDYTGNAGAGLQPYNSAQFVYAARPDVTPLYQGGSLIETTQRLTNVRTYAGANLVADYQLVYSTTIPNPSILQSVTLCAGNGSCLPPTSFTVTDSMTTIASASGGTFTYPNGWNFGTPPQAGYTPIVGDFNGDGKTDFSFVGGPYSYVFLNNGDGTFAAGETTWPNGWNFGYPPDAGFTPITGDFNRDGKTDFAFAWWNSIYVFISNSDGTFASSLMLNYPNGWSFSAPPHATGAPLVGDFNGDGRTDFALAFDTWIAVFFSNGDGTFSGASMGYPNSWNFGSPPQAGYTPLVGDFNGDGKTDFALSANNWIAVFLGNGDGTFSASSMNYPSGWDFGSPPDANWAPLVGDFNGDGRTDFAFAIGPNQVNVFLSKGDGTFASNDFRDPAVADWQCGTILAKSCPAIVGDFNGDGRTDFAITAAGTFRLFLSNGDGTFSSSATAYPNGLNFGSPPTSAWMPLVTDFNGDGQADLGFLGATTLDTLQPATAPPNFLLTTVTNGLGASTMFTYQPLTNGSVYTKGSGSTYPIVDVQGPMYVVSRVDTSNGVGGNLSAAYAYARGRTDSSGRGFLGFQQVTAIDLQTNIVKTTIYRQDYPYTALVASETQSLGGATLNSTSNTYDSTSLGGTRYQVFLTQSQATSNDLDGSPLPTVMTTYQYDAFGNATQVAVWATDGHIKTTTNTYTNDTVNWLLGRLTNATVTSVGPAPPSPPPPPAPTITLSPASLPDATYGGPSYSQTITASGGVAPYAYSVTAGALPAGLELSSAGVLSGAPTTPGTYSFTVTAIDAGGHSGSQAYSLTVVPGACSGSYTWTQRTVPNAQYLAAISSSSDGTHLAAADSGNGYIYTSADGGATWTQRTTGAGAQTWNYITSSSDGSHLAITYGFPPDGYYGNVTGYIYTSTNYGASWTQSSAGGGFWYPIASSSDGAHLAAGYMGGCIYTSANSGGSWTQQCGAGGPWWISIASSSDGSRLIAASQWNNAYNSGQVFTSTNGGANWTNTGLPGLYYQTVTSSSNGQYLAAAATDANGNPYFYTSTNYGVSGSWTQRTVPNTSVVMSIASSSDGSHLIAGGATSYGHSNGNYIYLSSNYGQSWTEQTAPGSSAGWAGVASSSDGSHLAAIVGNHVWTATCP